MRDLVGVLFLFESLYIMCRGQLRLTTSCVPDIPQIVYWILNAIDHDPLIVCFDWVSRRTFTLG